MGVAVAIPTVILPAIGFGAAGVVGGSVAAITQSTIRNVAAGSVFASLQSVRAVGAVSWVTSGIVTRLGTTVGAAASAVPSAISWLRGGVGAYDLGRGGTSDNYKINNGRLLC